MSSDRRTEMIENKEVHKWVSKRTALPTLDRVYDWNDIATITRSAPAKILGFEERGHLGVGANADVAVYDLEPENFDATKASNAAVVEDVLSKALYTIKDGKIVVKDGKIAKVVPSRHLWTNVQGFEQQEKKVLDDIMSFGLTDSTPVAVILIVICLILFVVVRLIIKGWRTYDKN